MSINLRVVVPPHPLIAHWLTILRDQLTPAPLFAIALEELGHWLTYEAVRDWLPYKSVEIQTPFGETTGSSISTATSLLAVQIVRGGQELWFGARKVLPTARLSHIYMTGQTEIISSQLPLNIPSEEGVLIFVPQITNAYELGAILTSLATKGVNGSRRRVITTIASNVGLKSLGESFPDLIIYCACIDPDLNDAGEIIPGFGNLEQRLYGFTSQ
ncbi:uracil phosphoribosyltransferase (chromatophore) [Paulinella micropora]|uniref:Uracil phosphoribosyltransferase n=1 Tax=Paulinella micropora TaxID=1928728 RepID=A0A1L5YBK0_9EUKA|nr:uracil phosphoribosyltransferase [Paulinella micropora]AQX44828.1 uracil phosphoribosyltransferase [Paulinella micropora]BBL86041.1 uracil phosphoribosyltransferase [Paulinella micropora]